MNPPDFDIVFSGSDSHIELCQSQANSGLNFPKILVSETLSLLSISLAFL